MWQNNSITSLQIIVNPLTFIDELRFHLKKKVRLETKNNSSNNNNNNIIIII